MLSCLLCMSSCSYLPDPIAEIPADVLLSETADHIALTPADSVLGDAIMMLPGGLVDPHAYVQTMMYFAEELNMLVVIPKVRGNLAITNPKAVKRVRSNFEGYRWILGGHSLGGTEATFCIDKHPQDWTALFLLGAYSTKDLRGYDAPIISIRGDQDKLATQGDWDKYKDNLPEGMYLDALQDLPTTDTRGTTVYFTILGGNHAQWGSYGKQKKDGEASISTQEQHTMLHTILTQTLRANGFKI